MRRLTLSRLTAVLFSLTLLLAGCTPGGDNGSPVAPAAPSAQTDQQAITNLLSLYQEAVAAEDGDRLAALLLPAAGRLQAQTATDVSAGRQETAGAFPDLTAFQEAMRRTFRESTVTALTIPPETVVLAPDQASVTFLEVESTLDAMTVAQTTRVYRTTWGLRRVGSGVVRVGISAVEREGPLVEVSTPGLLVAGPPQPVTVRAASAAFSVAGVDVATPVAGVMQPLSAAGEARHGTFTASASSQLQALPVQVTGTSGETFTFAHQYRLHQVRESLAQRVAGTGITRFSAVTVAPDGTVWAGGDGGGRLFQVAQGRSTAQALGPLLADPSGRIEDLAIDQRGRLHAVVFAPQTSGDIVLDQGVACQTVNVLDPTYPLRDPQDRPSPSTRVVPAADGAVWLLGSDGGVTQVTDTFRDGVCPPSDTAVQYGPVLRRQDGTLLTNTVPALAVAPDGALWLGTALGLTRRQDGQTTPVLFQREVRLQGDIPTLEIFFHAVAQALFAAQPLETVALGGVSFLEAFGRPLVKEDLSFSAVVDPQGRLWLGTLGGGLRRIELRDGVPQDTGHWTRQDGLGSTLILALAVGPDGAVWAATDEGVSRLRTQGGAVEITTFSVLENVPGPVRDVAVDPTGTVWLATDAGLFQLPPAGTAIGEDMSVPNSRAAGSRLVRVAGNNQSALPGQALPAPLVVRLEDALGTPVPGAPLVAQVLQGEATFLGGATTTTDAQGEAQFRLQAGASDADLVVEVAATPDVAPIQFIALVGAVDTPNVPLDLAVAGDLVFVADRRGGLQVIDVQDPTRPVALQANTLFMGGVSLLGQPRTLAIRDSLAFVGNIRTGNIILYILDLTTARAPTFPLDGDGDGLPDVVRGRLDFPGAFQTHSPRIVAVQGDLVTVLTNTNTSSPGALLVVDVHQPMTPRLLASVQLPVPRPAGLTLFGSFAYVAAGTAGLLVFDVQDPAHPVLVTAVGAADPATPVEVAFNAGLARTGDLVTTVETLLDRRSSQQTARFTVWDLREPRAPQRRGSVILGPTMEATVLASNGSGLAVAGGFAYVVRGALGVQVVDLRHPDAPRLVATLNTPSVALQVAAAGAFAYVTDRAFGLQVVRGPGLTRLDTDGDGVLDVFDHFPVDATESQDTDGDRLGNNTDPDNDNDGFSDQEEAQATPPTDPTDPLSFPLVFPPSTVTTLVLDAASPHQARLRNGTPETPYRSFTEALQVLHSGLAPQVRTLQVQPGTYAAATTQERFPLTFSGLMGLTVQAAEAGTVVVDAESTAHVLAVRSSSNLLLEGLVLTHGGGHGVLVQESRAVTLRDNHFVDNIQDGMTLSTNVRDAVITENLFADNGEDGLTLAGNVSGSVTQNTLRHNVRDGMNVQTMSSALVEENLIADNGRRGIGIETNSTATVQHNIVRQNGGDGILVRVDATADIIGNTIEDNRAPTGGSVVITFINPNTPITRVH